MRPRRDEELVIELPCSLPPERVAQLADLVASIYVQRHMGKLDRRTYPVVVD